MEPHHSPSREPRKITIDEVVGTLSSAVEQHDGSASNEILNRAIGLAERALDALPASIMLRIPVMNALSLALRKRFDTAGQRCDIRDIDRALELAETICNATCPPVSLDSHSCLLSSYSI